MDPSQNSQHPGAGGYGQSNRIDLNNFVPDFSKSNALKSRLYDSGISNNPMPSVKRPIEENISTKPFSAKMNSSKIQALSPLKKKIQDLNTQIISNLNESYREAAIKEAEYLGDGTADYYRSQHIIIPQPTYLRESTVGQKLQSSMAVSVGQPRMTGQLLNRKNATQMAPLDPEYQQKVNAQLNKTIQDPSKVMSGPPALVYAGFEGGASMSQKNLEQARSKFLLDKLTGKLPPRTLPPLQKSVSQISTSDLTKGAAASTAKPKVDVEKPNVVTNLRDDNSKQSPKPQQWGELDKYIELLLDTRSEEETVFTYLKCSDKGDPYDLQPCGYKDREDKYYTISGKGLTLYEKDTPVEFMSLGQWLIERDSYNHIKDFAFFKQFKSWKFMRMWKKTIKSQNKMKANNQLGENLFILQDKFRDRLFIHRKYMLEMANFRFVDTCQSSEYKTHAEFAAAQEDKRIKVTKDIEHKSRQSRENIKALFDDVLKKLRDQIVGEITMDETNAQKTPEPRNNAVSMKKKETNSVYAKLDFPEGMTYAHRSSLRRECSRFLRFAYLADFLSLDALSTIYIQSVKEMVKRVRFLDSIADMDAIMVMEFDDSNAAGKAMRGRDPLFYTRITLDDTVPLPSSEIKDQPIDDFLPPPRGKSKPQDFDLLAHLEVRTIAEGEEEAEEDEILEEGEETVVIPKYRKITPNIQDYWIKLDPGQDKFISLILKTFVEGLAAIKVFERWSKHIDLFDYAEILETWDDKVGDDIGEQSLEPNALDPGSWINEHPIQKAHKNDVEELVKSAYKKANMFLTRFQPLLEIFWRNKQFDPQILVNVNLNNSVESLGNTLTLLKYYTAHFQTQLPGTTDIGLLHLDSQSIKNKLAPTPKQLQDEIEKLVPRVTKERTMLVLEWLQSSIRDLQRPVNDVSDFVLQIQDFNKINEQFQAKRDQIDLYGQFHGVLANTGNTKLKKEDENAIKDAEKENTRLSAILADVESRQELEIERFKKELDQLIPQLNEEVFQLTEESKLPQYLDKNSDNNEMIKQLDEKMEKFNDLLQTSVKYNGWQEELRTQPTIFSNIEELRTELENRHQLWHALQDWQILKEGYEKKRWNDIDDDEIKKTSEVYQKITNKLIRNLPANAIVDELKYLVDTFKEAMPIVEACRNKNLTQEHWEAINDLIPNGKIDIEDENFTLQSLIDLDVNQYQDEIVAISRRATGEAKLKADLKKLQDEWNELKLITLVYKERDGVFVLSGIDDLYTFLDENLANINMIRGNQYKAVVEKDAENLRKALITMNTVTEDLLTLQRSWMYLENIFFSNEIKRALQNESNMFDKINIFFLQTLTQANKVQYASKFIGKYPKLPDQLRIFNEQVDLIMKKLEDYLETKRGEFPRFSFLSNDELLEILAKQSDPNAIQGFLKQLFDGLYKLELTETNDSSAMLSREGEKIEFKKPVKHVNKVEEWLNRIQDEMRQTLTRRLKEGNSAFGDGKQTKKEWVMDQPAQVVVTVDMIQWCLQTEEAITQMTDDPDSLNQWFAQNEEQLNMLTILVRGNLTDLKRQTIAALITQDVHSRAIIGDLRKDNVNNVFDFNWQKQLRYYYEEVEGSANQEQQCVIRQIQAMLQYGYEYMGATTRLVITPLTDKCWITITGALHIKLGANPAGPAGTGKTESTKDLAKGIAILCIVYNCSDQVDYRMMEKHLGGLAQQGCWTCLDEFNRILVEVLSVIAQQLQEIRKALQTQAADPTFAKFDFQGKAINLKPDFGCHITMNPGYAGRTELPDNLKVLFRPVAMMIPSYQLIAEVMLYSEGFGKSENLSKKMVQLYKLSSEQLSQQDHYDFGMRAVKSVLVMAGGLKRANPDDPEDAVLIRAMKDANVPKFLKDDLPLFNAIVQDLFPTVTIKDVDYSQFMQNIKKQLLLRGLQPQVAFMNKVIQLFETFVVRFGVMLVGFTGSGKTTCYEILADVMTYERKNNIRASREYQVVTYQVLNPKAISMGELYGQVDLATQEWTDGLASKILRVGAGGQGSDKEWTVFDGPVDALWIENMNTVLDDNMTLCLSNGQRIKLRPEMRMLFEVNDLRVASPATVSRCGMVYLTQDELGWEPYVKTWVAQKFANDYPLNDEQKQFLLDTFEGTVKLGLAKVRSYPLVEPIKTDDTQLVRSMCNILEILLLAPGVSFRGEQKQVRKDLESIFAFAYTFGLGSALNDRSKDYFDTTVKDCFKAAQYPAAFTCFDYFYDLKGHMFRPWSEKVKEFEFSKEKAFFDIMVETDMTYKHSYFIELLLSGCKPIFFTGETGVGKSVVIQNTLNRLAEKDLTPINLNFSAQTDSKQTQDAIQEKLEKISRKVLGALAGKRNAVFVDDINMPLVEEYGAQPPIELLRLLVDRDGLYERTEWEWKTVRDTTLIACAAPPLGGRAVLCTRFTTNFNMFCLPEATEGMLQTIFMSILGGFFKSWNFAEPVQALKEAMITSTIEVYTKIAKELRATPAKFHYSFNLRDVSKVVQGILMTKNVSISNPDVGTKLWVHEVSRVFMDRLINEEDRDWLINEMMEMLSRNFKSPIERDDIFGESKVKFGDVLKIDSGRIYEEIKDTNKLLKALEGQLEDYNDASTNKMNLVFFEDAILHILRICRSLRQPRGNIMLIGVGGSGKQSLVRLASFMYEFQFRQIEIKKNYQAKDFNEFIKEIMLATGVMGKEIAFTMTDSHILKESFLEDINNILNTGEVPNLMLAEDRDYICQELPNQIKIEGSQDIILQEFVKRVRQNFHICLCMSPVGNDLRVRCRQFPSLVNCCTLDWFSKWPPEALLYVSQQKLINMELPSEEIREELAKMCMLIHTSVEEASDKFYSELRRRVYTTPKSYLDLISLYINTLDKKRKEFNANKNRLSQGLRKLTDTNKQIAELKVALAEAAPILAQKDIVLAETMARVDKETEEANIVKAQVEKEEEIVSKQYSEANAVKAEVEDDLAAAKPEMDKAKAAVASLEAPSIVEMSSFAKPHVLIQLVVEPIMQLLGQKKDWATAQKQMKATQVFLKSLKEFDISKVSEKVITKIRKEYLSKPEFQPAAMTKISVPAGHLCTWVMALSSYQIVYKKIVPKKQKLAEVSKAAEEAKAILDEKLAGVRAAQEKVDNLNAAAQKLKDEKMELENRIKRDKARMNRAEKLVVLLKDEGIRWTSTVATLEDQINKLIGDVFLSCACISYFGGFSGVYRNELTKKWNYECIRRNIPAGDEFSLVKVMGDPVQISEWNMNQLPSDSVSLENGILSTKAERWGLCIDPQEQANKWLKNMFKNEDLRSITFTTDNWLRSVIDCVYNGKPLLIEDVHESIDPSIDSILLHQEFMDEDGTMKIKLDKPEPYPFGDGFKLFMTTKMPNPHYPPEVCIKVTLINFTVTTMGLEEQLLGDVVIKEKPEVEAQRQEIIESMDVDQKTLKAIENQILKLLAENEVEQILDEDVLIKTLEKSKVTSGEINKRMDAAVEVQKTIVTTRSKYVSVAVRGSILYFVISDMANINSMYQNSLQFVKVLFNKAIDAAPKSEDLDTRLNDLINCITKAIYSNISRGLFEADKLIFTYLIATSINRNNGQIDTAAWNTLLRGAMPLTNQQKDAKPMNPMPNLMSELSYDILFSAVCQIPNFEGIIADMKENKEDWQTWAVCDQPEEQKLPSDWEFKITDFHKCILLKCFRPEKLMFAFKKYVRNHMGTYYVEAQTTTMESIYVDTDQFTPLIFILSTGADPTDTLMKFAIERGWGERIGLISLGQGQTKKALELIDSSCKNGDWVLLQNCHLSQEFMPHLERTVNSFHDREEMSKDFRLYLTSTPIEFFPVSVLQNGVKLTTEPPRGIKANLTRTFAEISDDWLNDCKKEAIYRKMVFAVSFFHSIVQERRKFGPLGWNVVYDFNDSDLQTSFTMLKIFLDEQDEIPWDALVYVTGIINYGGRVTDSNDLRCMISILEKYYCIENLNDDYFYSESEIYKAPPFGNAQSYKDYIKSLPLEDSPEVFGLHDNANIAYQRSESDGMVEKVLSIQPRLSGGGAGSLTPDEIVIEKAKFFTANIPPNLDRAEGVKDLFKTTNNLLPSLTTVLLQEMEKFNRLLGVMRKSLDELVQAIGGFIVMSQTLDSMYVSLTNGTVPTNWVKVAYPSLKPLTSWFEDLIKRVVFLKKWLNEGNPIAYWISGFFFPQGFMTGCLQTHARNYKIAIDELAFSFEVLEYEEPDQVEERAKDGVYIYGLFMDGARFNREQKCIDEQHPDELYDRMPLIHFKPQKDYVPKEDEYSCPMYKTGLRRGTLSTTGQSTNYVISVEIPCSQENYQPPPHWIRRAAALLCQLND